MGRRSEGSFAAAMNRGWLMGTSRRRARVAHGQPVVGLGGPGGLFQSLWLSELARWDGAMGGWALEGSSSILSDPLMLRRGRRPDLVVSEVFFDPRGSAEVGVVGTAGLHPRALLQPSWFCPSVIRRVGVVGVGGEGLQPQRCDGCRSRRGGEGLLSRRPFSKLCGCEPCRRLSRGRARDGVGSVRGQKEQRCRGPPTRASPRRCRSGTWNRPT